MVVELLLQVARDIYDQKLKNVRQLTDQQKKWKLTAASQHGESLSMLAHATESTHLHTNELQSAILTILNEDCTTLIQII